MATIILVDDEQDILDPLQEMLEGENFRVKSLLELQQALAFLKSNPADLAVFDIKIPDMNGFQLLQEARTIHCDLPVIFLSSKTEEQDQLMDAAHQGMNVADRTVDSHLRNIRQKFKSVDPKADPIGTVFGLGYKLKI